jgi:O-antigen/teichoic acid export membrane protein
MGLGVLVTVVLDLALIPRFGALGAAAASSAAYLATTCLLVFLALRLSGGPGSTALRSASRLLEEET